MDARHRRQRVVDAAAAAAVLAVLATVAALTVISGNPAGRTDVARTSAREVLPFIHDDYPRALALAKRTHKPLFVDAWAPWCHSCQSLRTNVFTDPSLAAIASDFVWLSLDTERDTSAEWIALHPHSALPTLWVIDPVTGRPLMKWAGTATAKELRDLLAVAVLAGRAEGDADAVAATAAFVRGNHALAEGDAETAEREHRAAIAVASKSHAHRPRMVEALVTELSLKRDLAACAEVAAVEGPSLDVGTSRASVLVQGLACARNAKRDADTSRLLAVATKDAQSRDDGLLADDRSALYEEVVETRHASGDVEAARVLGS